MRNIKSVELSDKIVILSNTFMNCIVLNKAICPNNCTSMSYTYYNCRNLTGSPVCGSKVTNMMGTYYNCYNLTGSAVCGPNVTNMVNTYYNCVNLTNIIVHPSTPPTISNDTFYGISNTVPIYVHAQYLDAYKTAWSGYADYANRLMPIES